MCQKLTLIFVVCYKNDAKEVEKIFLYWAKDKITSGFFFKNFFTKCLRT